MARRSTSFIAQLFAAGTLAACSLALASPADAVGTPVLRPTDPVAQRAAQCVQTHRRVQVVLMIDASSSLRRSDPLDRRVTAAQSAVDGLAALAANTAGDPIGVELAVATFAEESRTILGWAPVELATAPQMNATLESLAADDQGRDTDYANAMSGATDLFASAPGPGAEACRVLAWFTDGSYSIETTTPKRYAPDATTPRAKIDAGLTAICRTGGLADQLRGQNVITAVFALYNEHTDLDAEDRSVLGAIATGEGAVACGATAGPEHGLLVEVSDASALVAGFDVLASTLFGGVAGQPSALIEACPTAPCSATRSIPVVSGISRIRLTLVLGAAGSEVVLGRGDDSIALVWDPTARATSRPFADAVVTTTWLTHDVVNLDVVFDGALAAADAEWQLTLVGPDGTPAAPGYSIFYFSRLTLAMKDLDPASRTARLELVLDQTPVSDSVADAVDVAVTASFLHSGTPAPTTVVALGSNTFSATLDGNTAASELRVDSTIVLGNGLRFGPISLTTPALLPATAQPGSTPTAAAPGGSRVPTGPIVVGVTAVALTGAIGLLFARLRRRRTTFAPTTGAACVVVRVLIGHNSIKHTRIAILNEHGAESTFRLSPEQFTSRLPDRRVPALDIGEFSFRRTATGARVSAPWHVFVGSTEAESAPASGVTSVAVTSGDRIGPWWAMSLTPRYASSVPAPGWEPADADRTAVAGRNDFVLEGSLVAIIHRPSDADRLEHSVRRAVEQILRSASAPQLVGV